MIDPTPLVAALPANKPFVGPEELARKAGIASIVRLGANESAFGPPPRALAAMRAEIERIAFYGDPEMFDLRTALARKHDCTIEEIAIGSGIDDLLGLIVHAYLAPGDVTVATRGSYPTYVYHVDAYGARLETVPYAENGTVRLDALATRARETRARIVYLANPDNPSGTFAGRTDVEALVRVLPSHALLVLDEAYGDFVATHDLLADGVHGNVVRMRTFSKAYGLAGARVAYAIAPRSVVTSLDKIRNHFGVNRIAQVGALAALDDRAFVRDVVAEVARGRDAYVRIATLHECATIPSHTNFVCIDCGSRARAEAVVAALLALGVFVRKPAFAPLDGYIRVTVGTAPERARFGTAFAEALAHSDANAPAPR